MKNFLHLILFLCPLSGFAGEGLIMEYQIVSDEYNNTVPKGKCLVYGKVFNQSQKGLCNGLVSTLDFSNQAVTDSTGAFKIWLSENDSSIFCFVSGHSEVIVYHDFKSQHAVNLNFYPQQNQEIRVVTKPVIYAYNPQPLEANISLDIKGEKPFYYPTYHQKWSFETQEDGQIKNDDGKVYPYLFWEAQSRDLEYKLENRKLPGYLIKTDTCIAFMENVLAKWGLNAKEKTDFITYWGPKMVVTDYCLVQFISGTYYTTEIAEIHVEPKPDNMLRLFMLISPIDEPISPYTIVQPEIPTFNREGFTIIEWGGSVIPLVNHHYLPKS